MRDSWTWTKVTGSQCLLFVVFMCVVALFRAYYPIQKRVIYGVCVMLWRITSSEDKNECYFSICTLCWLVGLCCVPIIDQQVLRSKTNWVKILMPSTRPRLIVATQLYRHWDNMNENTCMQCVWWHSNSSIQTMSTIVFPMECINTAHMIEQSSCSMPSCNPSSAAANAMSINWMCMLLSCMASVCPEIIEQLKAYIWAYCSISVPLHFSSWNNLSNGILCMKILPHQHYAILSRCTMYMTHHQQQTFSAFHHLNFSSIRMVFRLGCSRFHFYYSVFR